VYEEYTTESALEERERERDKKKTDSTRHPVVRLKGPIPRLTGVTT